MIKCARYVLALLLPAICQMVPAKDPPLFEEVPARATGIRWVHENAMSPQRYLPETLGPGCAFLDYKNDGWMDIYLVNSGPSDFYKPKKRLKNALYRNNGDGTFTDVTDRAGVAGGTFGMGVTVGDYDNDGYPDMLVTAYNGAILYHNNGDGTFADVTDRAGLSSPGWTTSAVWFDYDNDGWLDLFVCRFVEYGPDKLASCGDEKLGACSTTAFPASLSRPPACCFVTTGMGPSLKSAKGRPSPGRLERLWVS